MKAEQRFRLHDLLRYNLKTVRAYILKEAFQRLWGYHSPAWAGTFLDEWRRHVMALCHTLGKLPEPEVADFF